VEGGVKLNFLIFTISHSQKKSHTITQTLTFGELSRLHAGGVPNLESLPDSLSRAIATAAAVATQVSILPLSEATVNIEFVVEKKTGGGLSLSILGADAGGDIDFDKVSRNALEITFAR